TRELASELEHVLEKFALEAGFDERRSGQRVLQAGHFGHHCVGRAATSTAWAASANGKRAGTARGSACAKRRSRASARRSPPRSASGISGTIRGAFLHSRGTQSATVT